MWNLFADVNNWNKWDMGIEYVRITGEFEKGNYFELKPKGGPKLTIKLLEVKEGEMFIDLTKFPFAKMYDEHKFEETENGLKITATIMVKGLLGLLWRKLVAQNIVNGLPDETTEQIKYAGKL